jgi:LAO/AO transport system kinase
LGNITALSRAITLVESTNTTHLVRANVVKACLPHANKSIRIGITGVPGVGKVRSLKAETFNWIKKVAVLGC